MKNLLKVTLPDGTVIQDGKPTDTFVSTLYKLGLEQVNQTGYMAVAKRGIPLVGRMKEERTVLIDGWYIFTKFDVDNMARILSQLSDQLDAGITVEVVSEEGGRKSSECPRVLLEIEGKSYADIFRRTIETIGVERVRALNIVRSGRNIIYTPEPGQRPTDGQLDLGNGLFLNTKFPKEAKDKILKQIGEELGITISVI